MKKFIYIVLLSFVTSMTVISCTEEEVAPNNGKWRSIADPQMDAIEETLF